MKSIYMLALGCLLATGSAGAAEPVFSTVFTADAGFEQEAFDLWTTIDANTDEKSWAFVADGTPSRVRYSYHSQNKADDWFISPAITIPASGTYIVRYVCAGSSYGEAIEAWHGNAPTVEGMTVKGSEILNISGNSTQGYFLASYNAGDKVHVGFHAVSEPNKFRLNLNSVEMVAVSNPVDLGVSEIITPVSGEGLAQETVKVRVTNFSITDASGFDVCYTVNGGAAVTERYPGTLAAGQSAEYTFTAKADCSQPNGQFEINAYTVHANDVAAYNDAVSATVRHIAPATVPYRNGFEPTDNTTNFIYLNNNNDGSTWGVEVNSFWSYLSRTGDGYLCYNYDRNNAADDWVFIDPLEVEAGDYVLRFWYSATPDHKERLRVCWGDAPTAEAMTNTICEINPMTNSVYEESISLFSVPADKKIFVGFYAFSDADENWIVIDDLSIVKADASLIDVQLNAIVEPGNYIRPNNRRDVVAEIRNISVLDRSVDVSVYVDGKLAATSKENFRLMETRQITFKNVLAGLSEGSHLIKVEAVCANETETSNNVAEKEVYVLDKEPVMIWNLEDEEFPAGCAFRIEDDATSNPGDKDFHGDNLSIFTVRDHYLYGRKVLAVCTAFTDPSAKADRWFVLPQIHVSGDDAHLIWDASSLGDTELEDYDICVSTHEDVASSYSPVFNVNGEDGLAKTHGVSLAKYADKDIYVAFHVKTIGGKGLFLDNIGLYGNLGTAGIDNVTVGGEAASLRYTGTDIECGVPSEIVVVALDGKVVATGNGTSLDVQALPAGVYVARAANTAGSAVLKFAVR